MLSLNQPKFNSTIQKCVCPEVLIVDDETFNLVVYEGLFQKYGLRVTKAMSGEECIEEALKNHSFPCMNHRQYKLITIDN